MSIVLCEGCFWIPLLPFALSFFLSLLQLREEFDRGVEVQLDEEHSVHDVAALLKEFLRDMPDPLLTKELYTAFINTTCKLHCPFFPLLAWPPFIFFPLMLLKDFLTSQNIASPLMLRVRQQLSFHLHPNCPFSILCCSVRLRWAADCHSATGLPAPSMQQWHSPPSAWVPIHRDQPRPRPAGQRRTRGEHYFWNCKNYSENILTYLWIKWHENTHNPL